MDNSKTLVEQRSPEAALKKNKKFLKKLKLVGLFLLILGYSLSSSDCKNDQDNDNKGDKNDQTINAEQPNGDSNKGGDSKEKEDEDNTPTAMSQEKIEKFFKDLQDSNINIAEVKKIINEYPEAIKLQTQDGKTLAMLAKDLSNDNFTELINLIAEKDKDNEILDTKDHSGNNLLMYLVKEGYEDKLEILLAQNVELTDGVLHIAINNISEQNEQDNKIKLIKASGQMAKAIIKHARESNNTAFLQQKYTISGKAYTPKEFAKKLKPTFTMGPIYSDAKRLREELLQDILKEIK